MVQVQCKRSVERLVEDMGASLYRLWCASIVCDCENCTAARLEIEPSHGCLKLEGIQLPEPIQLLGLATVCNSSFGIGGLRAKRLYDPGSSLCPCMQCFDQRLKAIKSLAQDSPRDLHVSRFCFQRVCRGFCRQRNLKPDNAC